MYTNWSWTVDGEAHTSMIHEFVEIKCRIMCTLVTLQHVNLVNLAYILFLARECKPKKTFLVSLEQHLRFQVEHWRLRLSKTKQVL